MIKPKDADWSASTRWYDENPEVYADGADDIDMSALLDAFTSRIKPGGRILDYGCGSGRDLQSFLSMGYDAHGIDGSRSLIDICRARLNEPHRLRHLRFEDFSDPPESWDGIWALASLLHLPRSSLGPHLRHLATTLRPRGTLLASLKSGASEIIDARGRPMSFIGADDARKILKDYISDPYSVSVTTDVSTDSMGQEMEWTNIEITRS
jgi:SAM-dependent methyltransferase